jgi:hypothetical protein
MIKCCLLSGNKGIKFSETDKTPSCKINTSRLLDLFNSGACLVNAKKKITYEKDRVFKRMDASEIYFGTQSLETYLKTANIKQPIVVNSLNLIKEFEKVDNYDVEIRGWVKYWNDIFKFDDPLDPNLVKALIATGSSFDIEPKRTIKTARRLMQITNKTHRYLRDTKIELRDYLVILTRK